MSALLDISAVAYRAPPSAPMLVRPHLGLVVFEDRAEVSWLRALRPGFRHCFCLLGDGRHWVVCDPLLHGIAVTQVLGVATGCLAQHYRAGGRRALVTPLQSSAPPAITLPRPLTCVEVVKRLIGLQAPFVATPYQLFRRLAQRSLDFDQ